MNTRTRGAGRIGRRLAAWASALLLGAGAACAQTTYVSATGSDAAGVDGSYGNPWLTISNAVARTAAGTVMVATGQYVVSKRIAISKELTVRSWNEAAGGGEDPTNTVIDGNLVCSPLWINHAGARVSGFTVTRGNGVRADYQNGRGGGVLIAGGTLSNCVVVSNTANIYSGGIEMYSGARVTHCRVENNWTTNSGNGYAGGIMVIADGGTLAHSTVVSNATFGFGGGIVCGSRTTVSNCLVVSNAISNEGGATGGGVYADGARCLVTGCVISNNRSALAGGGVGLQGTTFLTLRDSTITHNQVRLTGGGFTAHRTKAGGGALVTNCLIQYNRAYTAANGYGAGISDGYQWTSANTSSGLLTVANCQIVYNGGTGNDVYGAVWVWTHGTAVFHNCIIASNDMRSSTAYAGFYIGTGSAVVVVRNCLIAGNRATNSTSYGGGIAFGSAACAHSGPNPLDVRIESCTIADNRVSADYGGMLTITNHTVVWNSVIVSNRAGGNYPDLRGGAGYIAPFYYSCSPVLSNAAQGNVTSAPVFAAYADANYRLAAGSPGLDAGANQEWMAAAADLDGRARLDRLMGRVDMGCYEQLRPGVLLGVR